MRVHELAKELGVTSKELLEALEQMEVSGKSASSSVPEDMVPRLRASGGKATAAPAKPREVLEPPPQPRKARPKRAAAAAAPAPQPAAEVPAAAAEAPAAPAPSRRRPPAEPAAPPVPTGPILQVVHGATPQVIAEKLDRSPAEIVKILFMAGEMATATTSLSDDAIGVIADDLGYTADIVAIEDELKLDELDEIEATDGELVARAPVVTIMGHRVQQLRLAVVAM